LTVTPVTHAPARGRLSRISVDVGLVALSLFLAWTMAARGLSAHLAQSEPRTAIALAPDNGDAALALSASALAEGRAEDAATLARRTLAADPFNAGALRELGLALDRQGEGDAADKVMSAAALLGWRDVPTQAWLVNRRLRQGRTEEAFIRLDALLRGDVDDAMRGRIFALMDAAAGLSASFPAVVGRLATDPPWRAAFLDQLPATAGGEASAYAVLAALRSGPAPPRPMEITSLVNRLFNAGEYGRAAASWTALSPLARDAGVWPHDGDFRFDADNTVFTWDTPQGVGAAADVEAAPAPGEGRALRIEYDGYALPDLPRQLLTLGPGAYRLSWRQMTEAGDGARLAWTVQCAGNGPALGRGAGTAAESSWTPVSFAFAVPPAGCSAQWLQLTAIPGERRQSIVAWYQGFRGVAAP